MVCQLPLQFVWLNSCHEKASACPKYGQNICMCRYRCVAGTQWPATIIHTSCTCALIIDQDCAVTPAQCLPVCVAHMDSCHCWHTISNMFALVEQNQICKVHQIDRTLSTPSSSLTYFIDASGQEPALRALPDAQIVFMWVAAFCTSAFPTQLDLLVTDTAAQLHCC